MSEIRRPGPDAPPGESDKEFDKEIDARSIGWFGVWLVVGIAVAAVAMWLLVREFTRQEQAQDRPVSPLVDRTQPRLPPEPRLQTAPEQELKAYMAEERRRASSYGWIDEAQGVVHIPVDHAMDLVLQRGLPSRPAAAAAGRAGAAGGAGAAAAEPPAGGGAHP